MASHRTTHYAIWFLLLGIIAGLATLITSGKLDSEAIWLLVTGVLGLIVGSSKINEGKWARPFDLIVGLIYTVAGILGVMVGFKLGLPSLDVGGFSLLSGSTFLGLSLGFAFPALVNLALGITSLRHFAGK